MISRNKNTFVIITVKAILEHREHRDHDQHMIVIPNKLGISYLIGYKDHAYWQGSIDHSMDVSLSSLIGVSSLFENIERRTRQHDCCFHKKYL